MPLFGWRSQFSYEPASTYREKEKQRLVRLAGRAIETKYPSGPPVLPALEQGAGFARAEAAQTLPKEGGWIWRNIKDTLETVIANRAKEPTYQLGGDWNIPPPPQQQSGGGLFGGISDLAGDVAGGVAGVAKRIPGTVLEGLDQSFKQVGAPLAGITTGSLAYERRQVGTDERGQPIYVRDAPRGIKFGPLDIPTPKQLGTIGSGIVRGLQDPSGAGEAFQEFQATGSPAAQVGTRIALDPTTWAGPGALKGVIPGESLAARAARGIVEQPRSVALGSIAGATGLTAAGDADLPIARDIPGPLRPLVGGVAGALTPGAVSRLRQAGPPSLEGFGLGEEAPVAGMAGPWKTKRGQAAAADFELAAPPAREPVLPHSQRVDPAEVRARVKHYVENDYDESGPLTRGAVRIETNRGPYYAGRKTNAQWREETETILSADEIHEAGRWYSGLTNQFLDRYGPEEGIRMRDAYLAGQVNTPVEAGLMNTHRVAEKARGFNVEKVAGVSRPHEAAVLGEYRGEAPLSFKSDKIMDFIDSAHGKQTRTYMGNDPRGGRPFAGDVHQARDAGYVDDVTRKWIESQTGRSLDDLGISQDFRGGPDKKTGEYVGASAKPDDTQYQWLSKWGNQLTDELNAAGWQGRSDWNAADIQAIGWMKFRRLLGLEGGTMDDAFRANTRRVAGLKADPEELAYLSKRLSEGTGYTLRHLDDGLELLGSPEGALDVLHVVKRAMGQDGFAFRELKSGDTNALKVALEGAGPEQLDEYARALRGEGLTAHVLGDRVYIVDLEKSWRTPAVRDAVVAKSNQIADNLGFTGRWADRPLKVETTRGADDATYLRSLDERGGGLRQLADSLADELAARRAGTAAPAARGQFGPEFGPGGTSVSSRAAATADDDLASILAPVAERRARNIGREGNTVTGMNVVELAYVLGRPKAEIKRLEKLYSASKVPGPAQKQAAEGLKEIRKHLAREWTDLTGRSANLAYRPGARDLNYQHIDEEVARWRAIAEKEGTTLEELDPLSDVGLEFQGSGDAYLGRENYRRMLDLERIAADPRADDAMRARAAERAAEIRGAEKFDIEGEGTVTTGSAPDIAGSSRKALLGSGTPAQMAARGAAGFASAQLEGEDLEESVQRGVGAALPGAAARFATRIGRLQEIDERIKSVVRAPAPPAAAATPPAGTTDHAMASRIFETANQVSRATYTSATTLDIGSALIQSGYMAVTHPVRWAQSIGQSLKAGVSTKAQEAIRASTKAQMDAIEPGLFDRALKQGLSVNAPGAAMTPGTATGDVASNFLEKLPGAGKVYRGSRRQFETQTEVMRSKAFMDMAKNTVADGVPLTDEKVRALANVANHVTGTTSKGTHPAMGILFGAPRFFAAQFETLRDALTRGGREGQYARRQLMATAGVLSGATVAYNYLTSGGKDWFGPGLGGPDDIKDFDDVLKLVTNSNFMKARVGDADISAFGPLDPLMRAFWKEGAAVYGTVTGDEDAAGIGKATSDLLRGKASPLVQMVVAMAEGGNSFTGVTYEDPLDYLADNWKRVMPIFSQELIDAVNGDGSYVAVGAGFIGARSQPLSAYERATGILDSVPDRYWQWDYKVDPVTGKTIPTDFRPPKSLSELTAKEKAELRKEYPALEKYLKGREEKGHGKSEWERQTDTFDLFQQADDEDLTKHGTLDRAEWREAFQARQADRRKAREDLASQGKKPESTTLRQRDLDELFTIWEGDDSGSVADIESTDAALFRFRQQIGDDRWKAVEAAMGWNKSEVVQEYLKDMKAYHTFMRGSAKYEDVPVDKTRTADAAANRARQVQAANPGMTQREALAALRDAGHISEEQYEWGKQSLGRKYTDEFNAFRESDEGMAALQWFKPVLYEGRETLVFPDEQVKEPRIRGGRGRPRQSAVTARRAALLGRRTRTR